MTENPLEALDAVEQWVTDRIVDGLNTYSSNRARTVQSAEGRLGMSDLGFCRNKAVLKLQKAPMDTPVEGEINHWPANVGSAIDAWVEDAFRDEDDVLVGDQIGKVQAFFPRSNAMISGTPDIVIPSLNLLLDTKTKNRLEPAKREGVSQNYLFQRHAYAMGCVEKGLLRDDGTMLVGNVYLDRSGKDRRPWVTIGMFDPTLTDVIDQWIEDVIYAIEHEEEASRDIPASMCPYFCEFFETCRGGVLEDTHDPTLITDEDALRGLEMYVEGQALNREGKRLTSIGRDLLVGQAGRGTVGDDDFQVRWTHVNATEFKRDAYEKIEVRRMKRKP